MAAEVERLLSEAGTEVRISGWINVPADCVEQLPNVHLHAARPAGVNEPRPEGAEGVDQILRMVASLQEDDVCLCLLTGGGSALLPAPVPGVTLADKLAVTRHLSAVGANILELNTVRMALSRIKGGGLARACNAGRLIALLISDVIGDPLEIIASGPTVNVRVSRGKAMDVLHKYYGNGNDIPTSVHQYLVSESRSDIEAPSRCIVKNHIVGNNGVAVLAAVAEAEKRGFQTEVIAPETPSTTAEEVGRSLANRVNDARQGGSPRCFVWGGEPVVRLVPEATRGLGGRNQQLALAALERLLEFRSEVEGMKNVVILSGGTDGEDGPTDAAGAVVDEEVFSEMTKSGLVPAGYLTGNDAYHFFEAAGGLIKTGPTHTNVCDLRIATVMP